MRKNTFLVLALFLIHSLFVVSQNQANESESNQNEENIQDSAVIVPESLNESLGNLLHNWQVDFSNSKNECDNGENIVYSDSVYIERLYNLPTEMELSFNSVVRTYIEMYTARRRDLVSYMLSLGDYYYPIFEEVLDRYELPLELKYLPVIESALNPVAVSRMGATGLWQFMLRTGQQYQLEVNSLVDERRDPYKATEAAARFLSDLYQIYGDWNLVIAAYNCGPGNVNKAIARSGGKRDYWGIYYRLPRETRGYVPAFIAATYIMNYNDEHRICPKDSKSGFMHLDTIHVAEQIHFKQISDVLDIPIEDIRRYNPQFKQDIIPGNHKPYALVLPTKHMFAFINQSDKIKEHNKAVYFTHRKQTLGNQYAGTVTDGNVINTYYKVKKGDNLGVIARRNRTTVGRIQRMNGMRSTRLSIGQRLIVKQTVQPIEVKEELASSGELKNTYYRIRRGDTLGALARRYGTTVAQLKNMNGMNSTRLSVGKSIVVKQERVATKPAPTADTPDKKVQSAKIRKMYPKVDTSSMLSGEGILEEYIERVKEEYSNNPLEVAIL